MDLKENLLQKKYNIDEEGSLWIYIQNMIESFRSQKKEQKVEYRIYMNGKVSPEVQQMNRINII